MNVRRLVVASLLGLASIAGAAAPAHAQTAAACDGVETRNAADGILCTVASCTDDFVGRLNVYTYLNCVA